MIAWVVAGAAGCFHDPGLGSAGSTSEATSEATSGAEGGGSESGTTSGGATSEGATSGGTTSGGATTGSTSAGSTSAGTTSAGTTSAGSTGDPTNSTGEPDGTCEGYCAKIEQCFPGQPRGCVQGCEGLLMASSEACVSAYVAAAECVIGTSCEAIGEGACNQAFWQADMICQGCEASFSGEGPYCEVVYVCGVSEYWIACDAEQCECYANGDPYTTCSPNNLCEIEAGVALEYASACCGWVL